MSEVVATTCLLRADRILAASDEVLTVEFAPGVEDWLPTRAVLASSPLPDNGGVQLEVQQTIVDTKNLSRFVINKKL
jgi:hypothetical protein